MIIGSVCLCQAASVWATVSASINPLPSDRLRCCDRYIRCQRSLAVKPLYTRSTRDADRPSHRPPLTAVWNTAGQPASAVPLAMSRYQFTHVRYRTAAAGRARWLACAALLRLTPQAKRDCGLWLLYFLRCPVFTALLRKVSIGHLLFWT